MHKHLHFLVILRGCPINMYATQVLFYLRVYLWWSLWTFHLHACQVRVTVGNSGLCCPCVTYFECWLTPLSVITLNSRSLVRKHAGLLCSRWNAETSHFMMSQTPVPHNPTWFMTPQAQTATQNDSVHSHVFFTFTFRCRLFNKVDHKLIQTRLYFSFIPRLHRQNQCLFCLWGLL